MIPHPTQISSLTLPLGDKQLLLASRVQARAGFDKGRSLEPESKEAVEAVQHAEGVSEVLLKNIVQGRQMEGNQDTYKLNIHEHTEKGDNDTVKNPRAPGGKVKVVGGS